MNERLQAALEYVRLGFSVIPLRFEGSVEDQKKPLLLTWEIYQKKPATERQVELWWQQWPRANVGLVTGAVGGLVAVDLDGDGAEGLLAGAGIVLDGTATVQTARGKHYLYRHPGGKISNRARVLKDQNGSGVDIRGDGGYFVAPPSIHGTGVIYTWERPLQDLAPLPDGLRSLIEKRPERQQDDRAPDWFREAWQGAPEGQRNETAARIAGYWLRVTQGNQEATYRAMEHWVDRCQPPMDLSELRTTIKSVARLEASKQRQEAEGQEEAPRLTIHIRDAVSRLVDALENEPPAFIPTPFIGLNTLLCGGLVPGELYYLAAKGGFGKTAFALEIFRHVAKTKGVLGISREMSVFALSRRLMAQESQVSASKLRQHRLDWSDWEAVNQAKQRLYDRHGWFSERAQTVEDVKQALGETTDAKLIVLDYLQLLQAKGVDRREKIETISRDLKSLAVDSDVAVLCLSAVTTRGEHNKTPGMHWLRESGMLEHDADVILLLDQPDETKKHERTLIIAKARDAETGTVPLLFTPEIVHFVERGIHHDA